MFSSIQYPIDSIRNGVYHSLPIIADFRTTDKLAFLESLRWTESSLGREPSAGQLYQNLAAAGFLSPTGACKPFDAAAYGYCRGEGAAIVFNKPLASAIEENDNILSVITGSAPKLSHITVPHSESQSTVYHEVARMAGIDPKSVSYVEAHGTGTPVRASVKFSVALQGRRHSNSALSKDTSGILRLLLALLDLSRFF